MERIFNSRCKYLLLLPLFFLVCNCCYSRFVDREIRKAMEAQKLLEMVNHVDMLEAAANATPDHPWTAHEDNIKSGASFIDRLPLVWGGAYKLDGGNLTLISERNFETDFDPMDYPEFTVAVKQQSGSLVVGFEPEGGDYRDIHLYFKWMPAYVPPERRYLVACGVSKYSVVTQVNEWVSWGQLVNTVVSFALQSFLIVLVVYLGHIYSQRTKCKWRGKWRGKWEGDCCDGFE